MAKSYFAVVILLLCPPVISCWILDFGDKSSCNPGCIRIYQWPSGWASLHVPKFTVQIINEGWHSQGVHDVRIGCDSFASTTLINPRIFRRMDGGGCLLNDGGVIGPGQVITFEYSQALPYTLTILSLKCA